MWFRFLLWWSLSAAPEVPAPAMPGPATPPLSWPPSQTAFTANSIESINLKVGRMEAIPIKAAGGLVGLFSCWGLGSSVAIVVWDFF